MRIYILILLTLILVLPAFAQSPQVTFTEVKIKDVGSVSIPSIMELQAGLYKTLSDAAQNELGKKFGFEVSGDQIVFQQKGLNDFNGFNTYARVMIATETGKRGDYVKLRPRIVLTKNELQQIDAATRAGIESEAALFAGMKILRWDGTVAETVNGRGALKTAYLRQLNNNPAVYVEIYNFPNFDRMHRLTISYRERDSSVWKDVLRRTRDSFSITTAR